MNTPATQPATPVTVGPSRLVRATFGPLTKVLNPVIVTLAGRRHVRFAARVSHTGRRSGRRYVTPVSARLAGDTFIIPLTFGSQSDWSRNVRAAGGCEIRFNGTDYRAARPELADGEQARDMIRAAFSPLERTMLRMLGIRQFLLLQRVGGGLWRLETYIEDAAPRGRLRACRPVPRGSGRQPQGSRDGQADAAFPARRLTKRRSVAGRVGAGVK